MIFRALLPATFLLALVSLLPAQSSRKPSAEVPEGIDARLDEVYANPEDRELRMDVFRPDHEKTLPAIVVVHGGGWLHGDKEKFRALTIQLAKKGYVAAAIEYRLSGEAKFPAAVEDCNAATRYLRANAARYGLDPERIGAVGGSAGGHLVGLMATSANDPELNHPGADLKVLANLQAAVVMAGPFDLTSGPVAERSGDPDKSFAFKWLGGSYEDIPEVYRKASPFHRLSRETPPTLFLTGDLDNPERDVPSIARLRELGVSTDHAIFKDGKHGCWNVQPWFDDIVVRINEWMTAHLGKE